MAAVTIHSDFGAQENKVCHCFPLFPHLFSMKWLDQMPWSYFFECWVLSQLFNSSLSLSSRGSLVLHFLSYEWCHLHIWGYGYFSRQFWFQLVLHPSQHFAWCTLHISYINKQGDNIQLCHTSCAQNFICALQRSVSIILCKFCNQIPLASKDKFPGGSQSLCLFPRLGNLLWALELS